MRMHEPPACTGVSLIPPPSPLQDFLDPHAIPTPTVRRVDMRTRPVEHDRGEPDLIGRHVAAHVHRERRVGAIVGRALRDAVQICARDL